MKTLEIPNVPDEMYVQIEKLARVRGRPIGEVAVEFLAKAMAAEEADEDQALAAIRADREAMARRGVCLTPESLREAKNWGRE